MAFRERITKVIGGEITYFGDIFVGVFGFEFNWGTMVVTHAKHAIHTTGACDG
jgi:hypothetical protein